MRLWIKNPLAIHAPHARDAGGGLVIEDQLIAEVVPNGGAPEKPVDNTFDASEHVVLPGLINTHHHFYQTLTRACPTALNKPLFPWLKSLYKIWAGLDDSMIALSTRLASAELLLSGCTTSADHHYLFPEKARHALDTQVEAIGDTGIRATLTRGSMSLGEDQGGLPPRNTVQTEEDILADCEAVIGKYHDGSANSALQIALAPCSPFSVSTDLMRESAQLARRHGVRLHTHLAETHDETAFCLRQFGMRPVDYLESVGWLSDDVWLAHGIHFSAEEIQRLGAQRVGIAHCPSSNMLLASGTCATLDSAAAGSPIGIGVDGSASNDGSNMIQELRQALLLQRLHYGAERISHQVVLNWATEGSAACLGRSDIGHINPGMLADLALFQPDELRFSGVGDPLAALLLCGAHHADHVMVGGQWKVSKGELLTLDTDQLMHEHQVAAKHLLKIAT